MARWIWPNGLAQGITAALLVVAGCHHASYSDDAGGGDTDSGPCTCDLSQVSGSGAVACGAYTCVAGQSLLCSEGTLLTGGDCLDASSSGAGSEGGIEGGGSGGCVPECNGTTCGETDGCGSTCKCATGLTCNGGLCGNGCQLLAGQPCLPAGSIGGNSTTCCQEGNQCAALDSGATVCCAQTNTASTLGGLCQADTDCCDYPAVHCSPTAQTCM